MPVEAPQLTTLIETEFARLGDDRMASHVRSLLVEPAEVVRAWDYGEPGDKFVTWIVLSDQARSNTGIAYCEYGFGPRSPWGWCS
jgi:hypothetical protein